MDALKKSLSRLRTLEASVRDGVIRTLSEAGAGGVALVPGIATVGEGGKEGGLYEGVVSGMRHTVGAYRTYRGWLYSVVNAIAVEGAGQLARVGRLVREDRGKSFTKRKWLESRMPERLRFLQKDYYWEITESGEIVELIDNPNPVQNRWQFVYSFLVNLCLTGWAFVVRGENKETKRPELYVVPTTWVRADHTKGPFSRFLIGSWSLSKNPLGGVLELGREYVAFAHLPNPGDPTSAMSPADSQYLAIRIDDHIQTSQLNFFDRGIFPSVAIVIGRGAVGEGAVGVRPRLSWSQRKALINAVMQAYSGVVNYGHPLILDGLIEKIERFSATSEEMGWDRSEDKVRARILSAYGVHPYILGEAVDVGGYAQVANIEKRFYKRVNAYLELLSLVVTSSIQSLCGAEWAVWWEPCRPIDDQLYWENLRFARQAGDLSREELRTELGLPPSDHFELNGELRQYIIQVMNLYGGGFVREDQAVGMLVEVGIPEDSAKRIVYGNKSPKVVDNAGAVGGEASVDFSLSGKGSSLSTELAGRVVQWLSGGGEVKSNEFSNGVRNQASGRLFLGLYKRIEKGMVGALARLFKKQADEIVRNFLRMAEAFGTGNLDASDLVGEKWVMEVMEAVLPFMACGAAVSGAEALAVVGLDVRKYREGVRKTKKTTASDWVNSHLSDWEKLVGAAEEVGLPLSLMTELPDWLKEDILSNLESSFKQPYWRRIQDTTVGKVDDILRQGVAEGWSVDRIAKELKDVLGGDAAARRRGRLIARTELGNALNGGRKAAINGVREELGGEGRLLRQVWYSVLGTTTRDTHAALDGVPEDETGCWTLAGIKVPWPGHWSLPPEERCNCQCTIVVEFGNWQEEE